MRRISQRLRLLVFSYSFSIVSPKGSKEKRGSSKLRDGQRGSRRLCSVWIGRGRLKKRLAFTPKRKSKNWRNGNFGSIVRSSPSQKTNDADENHCPHRYPIGGPRGQSGDLGFNTSRRDGAFRCQRRFPKDRGPLVVASGLKSSR